jgi:GntR family transcriptional regulator
MRFQLNFKSGKPVYLQITDQVKAAVASGAAQPGDALPSIRPLAEELRVNRNTIAKAYTELESQGVIETAAGRGCFIGANNATLRKDARVKLLNEEIDQAVVQAHHLQVSKAEFLRLSEERYETFARRRARAGAASDSQE